MVKPNRDILRIFSYTWILIKCFIVLLWSSILVERSLRNSNYSIQSISAPIYDLSSSHYWKGEESSLNSFCKYTRYFLGFKKQTKGIGTHECHRYYYTILKDIILSLLFFVEVATSTTAKAKKADFYFAFYKRVSCLLLLSSRYTVVWYTVNTKIRVHICIYGVARIA